MRTTSAVTARAVIVPNFINCAPSSNIKIAIVGVGGRGKEFLDAVKDFGSMLISK